MAQPRKWDYIVEEVKKCVCLCANCHRELHDGLWQLEDIELVDFMETSTVQEECCSTGKCPICDKDVFATITCSLSCAAKKRISGDWMSKEELIELKKQYTITQIADMLGVSADAVRKRQRKLGIF